ncbi:hypothetical protein LTR78_007226 [Recurvomyces mirabilis]|uniref:Uncharacterized protein n=1 Tax=Recurvomyces mirabilis TaxID=574656 RepID=A0AAE1BYP7_9PEZI|nr:hypothetical protein LTR78_007226 [Recurvomyces mirabilis]KAK5155531.1 hypothetical protein LTS14_005792 [Recurvomyces mirabilis]
MSSTSKVDLNAITEQLLSIIKTCAESNNIKETLQTLPEQEGVKDISDGEHIKGLRTQILANAEILLPILVPESVGESLIDGRIVRTLPPIQVITANAENRFGLIEIHASVTFGDLAVGRKSALMFISDGFPTVTEAFRELLAVSGRLITKHYTSDSTYALGAPEKIEGGGYFTTNKLGQDVNEESSYHDKQPTGPTKTGYKRNLTGARKAHLLSVEPNASFSFPSDDGSSASPASTTEDDSPILNTFPVGSHSPDSSTFPISDDRFFHTHVRTNSVSSITANAGACYPKDVNSTYKKMRYFENLNGPCNNINTDCRYENMNSRKPSKPECRPDYIDDFLSPKTEEYTIVHSPAPREYTDEFHAQYERDGRHDDSYSGRHSALDW